MPEEGSSDVYLTKNKSSELLGTFVTTLSISSPLHTVYSDMHIYDGNRSAKHGGPLSMANRVYSPR